MFFLIMNLYKLIKFVFVFCLCFGCEQLFLQSFSWDLLLLLKFLSCVTCRDVTHQFVISFILVLEISPLAHSAGSKFNWTNNISNLTNEHAPIYAIVQFFCTVVWVFCLYFYSIFFALKTSTILLSSRAKDINYF